MKNKKKTFNRILIKTFLCMMCFIIVFLECPDVLVSHAKGASLIDKSGKWYLYVYSASETAGEDGAGTDEEKELTEEEKKQMEEDEKARKELDFLTDAFLTFLDSTSGLLFTLFEKNNIGIESLVMGRVNRGCDSENLIAFELVEGNILGILGAKFYVIFRSIVQALMLVMLFAELVRQAFKMPNAQTYVEFKSFIMNLCINFMMLFLMPIFLEFIMFFRDYALKFVWSNIFGDVSVVGIYDMCKLLHTAKPFSISNTILWLGAGGATIVFIFTYAGIAASLFMGFSLFPVICLLTLKNRKLLDEWLRMMGNNIVYPLIDLLAISIPIYIGCANMVEDSTILAVFQVVMILMIVPVRKRVGKLLGADPSIGNAAGFMSAVYMARNVASDVAQGVNAVKGGINDAKAASESSKADLEKADMYDELANPGRKTISDPEAGSYGGVGHDTGSVSLDKSNNGNEEVVTADSSASIADEDEDIQSQAYDSVANDDMDGSEAIANTEEAVNGDIQSQAYDSVANDDMDGLEAISNEEAVNGDIQSQAYDSVANDDMDGSDVITNNEDTVNANTQSQAYGSVANETVAAGVVATDALSNRSNNHVHNGAGSGSAVSNMNAKKNGRVSNIERMDGLNRDIEALKQNKSDLREANTRLKLDKEMNGRRIDARIQELKDRNAQLSSMGNLDEQQTAERNSNENMIVELGQQRIKDDNNYDHAILENEAMMANVDSELTNKQNELAHVKNSEKVMSNGKMVASGEEYNEQQRRNQILAKHATIQNFENPEIFNALTETQKAEMYRQRAAETKNKSREQIAKSVVKSTAKVGGRVAGTFIGGAAMSWGGAETMGAGAYIGGMVGAMGGSAVGTIDGHIVGKGVNRIGVAQDPNLQNSQSEIRRVQTEIETLQTMDKFNLPMVAKREKVIEKLQHDVEVMQNNSPMYAQTVLTTEQTANVRSRIPQRVQPTGVGGSMNTQSITTEQIVNVQERVSQRTQPTGVGGSMNTQSITTEQIVNVQERVPQRTQVTAHNIAMTEQRTVINDVKHDIVGMDWVNSIRKNGVTSKSVSEIVKCFPEHMQMDVNAFLTDLGAGAGKLTGKDFSQAAAESFKRTKTTNLMDSAIMKDLLSGMAKGCSCEGDVIVDINTKIQEVK